MRRVRTIVAGTAALALLSVAARGAQYSIGDPSPEEQLYVEYVNRARADALAEANRLKNETDPDVLEAYEFFEIDPQHIVDQFAALVADGRLDRYAQPLSINFQLLQASELHSLDMLLHDFQGHSSSNDPPAPFGPGFTIAQRAQAFGYVGVGGENVYAYSESVVQGHAGFDVDWGYDDPGHPAYDPTFAGQGMQNPAGHRANIHNGDFKEIGVGHLVGTNGEVGPELVTQMFGSTGNIAFITGVVYEDANANQFYDVGEGRSDVRIDIEGSADYAMSSASGGYSVPVLGDGLYNVTFTGGGLTPFATTAAIAGGLNVKVDYVAVAASSYPADFDENGAVEAADLAQWRDNFGASGDSDADNDGDSDGGDFLAWQRQLGLGVDGITAVAEPYSMALAAFPALAMLNRRRPSNSSDRRRAARR